MRQVDEQYAWPRSHDAQIAKRRLQCRQVFWRSGVSTTSERQRVPTGHGAQTVAQERRLARSVGASRRSPRVWRDQLQALTSDGRGPQLTRPARDRPVRRGCGRCRSGGRTERVHRCLEISLENARFPQCPQPFSFFQKNKEAEQLQRRWSRFTRFQVSADTSRRPSILRANLTIRRRLVVSEAAEQRENGLSLAGLAQVGDASCTFGLFTAAGIVKCCDDDHRNR